MNADIQPKPSHHTRNDAAIFVLTVVSCFILMSAACLFAKPVATIAEPMPELAMPQPPGTLLLVPEPNPLPALAFPIDLRIGVCWDAPKLEVPPEPIDDLAIHPPVPQEHLPEQRVPFHGIIVQVADRYEVDPHLIRAIILAESGYNPKAKSKKGALGLMQLMPSTAKALGVQDIYDPEENIDGGVRYFRSLLDRFDGDVQLALAAYNAGSRHVRNYEGIPPFKATRHYIKKVLKFQEKFKLEKINKLRRLA